ncbi:hypothetical protein [Paraburkholderia acidisoli]|nr:hypothetical protein [Paraburkholderia acidisoli]
MNAMPGLSAIAAVGIGSLIGALARDGLSAAMNALPPIPMGTRAI